MPTGASDESASKTVADYPSERPDKQAFDKWFAKATTTLTTQGYGSLLRQEVPYELRKLIPRPLVVIPADPTAAAAAAVKNADIQWQNDVNAKDVEARTQEIETRLGAALWQAFQANAKLSWEVMAEGNQYKDGGGFAIGSVSWLRDLGPDRGEWKEVGWCFDRTHGSQDR